MGTVRWTITASLLLLVSFAGGCVTHPPEVTITRRRVCDDYAPARVDLVCDCWPSATTCYCDRSAHCACFAGAVTLTTRAALSRPLRRAIRRQAHRTGHQIHRQTKRFSGQVKSEAQRTGRRVGSEARRTGRRVNREYRRSSRRVSKQLKRTGRDIKKFFKKLF